ncbi:MAG TPA: hypothetical protein VG733_01345 [Chthoniobacteraceae bacterium]|nr:hypothetical protein [Chthoniobacteraceae bacterium]
MKHVLALLVFVCFAAPAFADNPPPISAVQAAEAAQKVMDDLKLPKDIYIASVTLTHATLLGGDTYWLVKYSHPVPSEGTNDQEVGIKVRLDGSVARVVKHLGK